MQRFLTILAFSLTIAGSVAMADPPGKGVFPYSTTEETLENGLHVILVPMPGSGLVSYYSVVRTGSRDEYEPGHSGFAHFFEHMMFRGTKKYPGSKYDQIMTEMGADANAYTTDDYTCYHLTFAPDDLERVMELESDRFQNLDYAEREFQTESGAVHGEYRKGKTSPWQVLFEKLQDVAFDVHTYKHTTIGFEADIKAMPTMYEYSKNFFSRYYRPENVVLVIVGDIAPAAVMTQVRAYYGGWKKGYVAPKITPEPPQTAARTAEVTYPGKTLPILAVGYKGEKFDPSNKLVAAAMLFGDLAFGENSELSKRLTLKEQKVQFISADVGMNRDMPLWSVMSMVKNAEDLESIREQITATIASFAETPVNLVDLNNLKRRLRYSFLMNLDTPEKTAGALARYIALTGGIDAVDALYAAYDVVTPEDIMQAVRTYFTPERSTTVTLTGSLVK